jgi:hypothetical protein
MRRFRMMSPEQIHELCEKAADRKHRENLAAVRASKTGQGLDGRLGSQPSGLERLGQFYRANGRADQ